MIRNHPMVRALCQRVRRPVTIQILAGLALIAPAGLMTMRDAEQSAIAAPAVLDTILAVAPALSLEEQAEQVAPEYASEYKISPSLAKQIYVAAVKHEIEPTTAFGLVRAESSFRTAARSPVGALAVTRHHAFAAARSGNEPAARLQVSAPADRQV